MTRILIIGMHNKIGGVETFLMNYYRNIDKDKIQFDFINMYDKICFEDEILKLGAKVYKIPNVKKNPVGYYKTLKNIIIKNSYEIIHINMLSVANILPVFAARRAKVKHIIVHSHNTNTPQGLLRKLLDRLNKRIVLKYATDLFACSEIAGNWMFGKEPTVKIIHNAVEVEKFKFNQNIRNQMRKKMKIEDNFVIGHVGRFSEQKNHELLIEIFKRFSKDNQNATLLMIGEGELKSQIKEKVKKYGLQDKTVFLEPVGNVNDYFQAMDLFLLPSKFEGLPVVAVEAETNGLPVITSNTVSRELPIKELTSYCPLDDIEYWNSQMIQNKIQRKDRTIDITLANYNIKEEVKKLEKIYETMINKHN